MLLLSAARVSDAQPWNMGVPPTAQMGYSYTQPSAKPAQARVPPLSSPHCPALLAVCLSVLPGQVDFFFDFLCPDSKAAFPGLTAAVDQLAKQPQRMDVALQLHMFPLVRSPPGARDSKPKLLAVD